MGNFPGKDGNGVVVDVLARGSGTNIDPYVLEAPAATATEVASGTSGVQGKAAAANLRLLGFGVRENASAADVAEVLLRHGTANTDPLLAPVELAADQSVTVWFGLPGIACPNGVYVDRTVGETHLVLYTEVLP